MTLRRLKRTINTGGWLPHSPFGRPLATQAEVPPFPPRHDTAYLLRRLYRMDLRSQEASRQRQREHNANVGKQPDVVVRQSWFLLATMFHGVLLACTVKIVSSSGEKDASVPPPVASSPWWSEYYGSNPNLTLEVVPAPTPTLPEPIDVVEVEFDFGEVTEEEALEEAAYRAKELKAEATRVALQKELRALQSFCGSSHGRNAAIVRYTLRYVFQAYL